MTDIVSEEQRSYIMSRVRSKNTKPEILVRSYLHRCGLRFRVHGEKLPGKPDLVLPKYSTIVFVHGCFWHMHECRYGVVQPKTNAAFWKNKRETNVQRDREQLARLDKAGWQALVVWECETRDVPVLQQKLFRFLEGDRSEE